MSNTSAPSSLIGTTIGSYKIIGPLGQGGMSAIFRGYQESIDRSVAIKILPAELLHDPNFLKRFINEARTLAKLQHPNILPLYDFGEVNGIPYIIMPLMSGGTLANRIQQGRLSPAETARLLTPIAEALDYAHSEGLLHRDIKPNNILFDPRGTPMLADFGIAKSVENPTGMTGTGIIGTPDYMSPEQARGETLDHRSDIYALAVVVYHVLTGQKLFQASEPMSILFKHVTEQPRPLRMHRPDLSPAVEAVVMKSLAKDPAHRHQSASDFMRNLAVAASASYQPVPQNPTAFLQSGTIAVPATEGYTSPKLSSATGLQPALDQKKKINPGFIIGGVIVTLAVCAVGMFALVGLGVISVGTSAAAATSEAGTAQALSVRATQESVFGTQAAIDAEATATAGALTLAEPINRAESWPLVFQDDFSQDEGYWPVGPLTGGRVTGTRYIQDNSYLWNLSASDSVNIGTDLNYRGASGDFYVAVDARQLGGPSSADYGLIFCRVSSLSLYYFAISDSGTYAFYISQGGNWEIGLEATPSDAIVPGAFNRLAVVVEGNHFTFYVNEARLADIDDDRLGAGGFGLSAQLNAGERAQFEFDNFEIRVP